jgi:hypothetical protein
MEKLPPSLAKQKTFETLKNGEFLSAEDGLQIRKMEVFEKGEASSFPCKTKNLRNAEKRRIPERRKRIENPIRSELAEGTVN